MKNKPEKEMISYELAKKLKEAGFPQSDFNICGHCAGGLTMDVFIPTLSELIEACGERFESLGRDEYAGGWVSFDKEDKYGRGFIPEESVANLWLEINEKI